MELSNEEMLSINGGVIIRKEEYMQIKELNEKEMLEINGGALTSAFISAINGVINTLYELGKETGSSLRRLTSGKYCPIN